jgi:hypothetical protein
MFGSSKTIFTILVAIFSIFNELKSQTVGIQLYTFSDFSILNTGSFKKPQPGFGGSIGLSAFTDSTEVGVSPNFMVMFDYGFPISSEVTFPFKESQNNTTIYTQLPVTTSYFRAGVLLGLAYEKRHKYRYPCISFGIYGTRYKLYFPYEGLLEPEPRVVELDSSQFNILKGGLGFQFNLQKFYTKGKLDFFWSTSVMVNAIELNSELYSTKHLESIPILLFNLNLGIRINLKETIEKLSIY